MQLKQPAIFNRAILFSPTHMLHNPGSMMTADILKMELHHDFSVLSIPLPHSRHSNVTAGIDKHQVKETKLIAP